METANTIPISRSEYVELSFPAQKVRTYFKDQENLRGKKIKSLDCFRASLVSKSPSGATSLNNTAFAASFLVLVSKGKEAINRIPLTAIEPNLNNGRRLQLKDLEIDFTKSYVECPDPLLINANEALTFNFYFDEEGC
jgi:hypothetical protein